MERYIENLSFIGSLGMMSDIMNVTKVTRIPGAVKFTITPVVFKDAYDLLDTFTKFTKDWQQYGDGWLATQRNLHGLFGVLGSYPRYTAERTRTAGQKIHEEAYRKGIEKREIFQLLLDGNWEGASRRVRDWKKHHDEPLTMNDISTGAFLKWAKKKARAFGEQKAGKDKREARRIGREKLREFRGRISPATLQEYREAL
jgi:hypothetical protein